MRIHGCYAWLSCRTINNISSQCGGWLVRMDGFAVNQRLCGVWPARCAMATQQRKAFKVDAEGI